MGIDRIKTIIRTAARRRETVTLDASVLTDGERAMIERELAASGLTNWQWK